MARYIDADALLETLNGLYNQHLTMHNYAADGATADCIEAVILAPTADVAPKSEVALAFMDWLQANDHINKSEACRREICELFLADELKKKYTEAPNA